MNTAVEQLKKNRAFLCLECGKCTAVCPISKVNNAYSPRRLLAQGLFYGAEDIASDHLLWSCLTCLLCSQRCPVDVKYSDYMRDVRAVAHQMGYEGNASHGGALHHIMEIAASPRLKQNRTEWVTKDLKVKQKGDTLYFVGCLPYYEELFGKDFSFSPVSIAVDTVKILNHIGIEPVVLDNERCCGHDLYWLGRLEQFDELGKLNLKEFEQTGVKKVITSCPECALALRKLYPERLGDTGLKVQHITEVLAENKSRLRLGPVARQVAFQDPCRLGRFMGVYEPPREVLAMIPGVEVREMAHSKKGAVCCGTTNWVNCDATCKQIQKSRFDEAKAAGAKTLVTACPKCQIHFRCAQCGESPAQNGLDVTDFVNIVASALKS